MAQPITAPSGQQQNQLLEHVYKLFKTDPATVQYIEAHGNKSGYDIRYEPIFHYVNTVRLKIMMLIT